MEIGRKKTVFLRKSVAGFLVLMIILISAISINYVNVVEAQIKGRILFDETLNEYWESRIDTGYGDLAEELRNDGFVVESLESGSITYEKLSQYDVFAITAPFTPPKSLTNDEISAIKQFVSEGGGLFLAALGWSWVAYTDQSVDLNPANQIGREFGIVVNNDVIYDETDNDGDPASPLFHNFASHPVTAGIKKIWGSVPSSLTVSRSAVSIVWGDDDAYARNDVEKYSKGLHPPFVTVAEYGQGRVIYVASDGMFHAAPYRRDSDNLRKYDNLKFALNIFNWLSARVQNTISDVTEDWLNERGHDYTDITLVAVTQTDETHLQFEMQTAGNVPSNPQHYLAYVWSLDTDRTPSTGDHINDIGVDLRVRVGFDPNPEHLITYGWHGYIDKEPEGVGPLESFTISGNYITITVSIAELGNPPSFDWFASNVEEFTTAVDYCPDTGYETYSITSIQDSVSVFINDPSNEATVSGYAEISATASSSVGYPIINMLYKIDGGNWVSITLSDGVGSASWDTTTVSNGAHTITVQATDSNGIVGTESITVTVNNITPIITDYTLLYIILGFAGIIGAFLAFTKLKPLPRRKKMEIKILYKVTGKLVRMRIKPKHTIGSLVNTLIRDLKLPEDKIYTLACKGKEYGPDEYQVTIEEFGVNEGDQIELISKTKGKAS